MDLQKTLLYLVITILLDQCQCHCPDAWTYFQGSCYLFARDNKTFTEAEHFCRQHTSHLVKIETDRESSFLYSMCSRMIVPDNRFWIGLTDTDIEGIWKWMDGSEPIYTNWGPGNPVKQTSENCAVVYKQYGFQWIDEPCSLKWPPICELSSHLNKLLEMAQTTDSTEDHIEVKIGRPKVRGIELLRDPLLNKGSSFSLKERQLLGLQGLLPPAIMTPDQQVYVVMQNFYRWDNDLDRYIYMMSLQDRNEKLFYKTVTQNVELMMPIIYTPTVGQACLKYGLTMRKPRGLYITIHDLGHVYDILCNWPNDDVKVIVVTDGERILGLGDLGAYGMGIPVGKLSLYTALAGVQPHHCLPITLDVGTDNEALMKDPLYIGLKQKRERGPSYDQLIEEFMHAVVKRYGGNCLVQFEDFGNHNAFRLLEKYRSLFCCFNDDIQGTAAVAVAGLLASLKITGKSLRDNRFVFQGAGEASIGIAKLLMMALKEQGATEQEAYSKIWMVDSRGLIVKDRPAGGVSGQKVPFAQNHAPIDKLEDVVKQIKPTAIIGAAAQPGAFTETILKDMASFNDHPIIFALSNPTSKAECTAEQAYRATKGKCVFASGSPFKAVTLDNKTFHPGQGNNAYVFPAVGLATIACDIRTIPETIFLESAKALAAMVTKKDLDEGRVYPPLGDIQKVSTGIAVHLAEYAYNNSLAYFFPQPKDLSKYIKSYQYDINYEEYVPELYDWPGHSTTLSTKL